jgi:D-arabinose 1-dehydrogenase-like Zn-dependent alcohol dehydrogenase
MKSQSIINYAEPLQERVTDTPVPRGSEVLVKVSHCGVCHSDVHLHDGFFDLGDDRKLDISGTHELPLTLGHEIVGEVVACGPEADGATVGERRVVYPWIGCSGCALCDRGDEHLCNKPRALGINVNGGFADYVLVPHPRYLLAFDGIEESLAGPYMCSGLTAYSALRKAGWLGNGDTLAIVGLGGVGMMGLQFARALYPDADIVGADIDDASLQVALQQGAARVYNTTDKDAGKQLLRDSGGGAAVAVDFVGAETSLTFAQRSVAKGGKVIIVGLFGGRFSLPIPMFPFRELTLSGSYVGSLAHAGEMMTLVKTGQVNPIPVQRRALERASESLDDLRAGRVVGRVVLDCQG